MHFIYNKIKIFCYIFKYITEIFLLYIENKNIHGYIFVIKQYITNSGIIMHVGFLTGLLQMLKESTAASCSSLMSLLFFGINFSFTLNLL